MTTELPETVQRWTAKRRSALVLSILRGETSAHAPPETLELVAESA